MNDFKTVKEVREVLALTLIRITKYYRYGSWEEIKDIDDNDLITHMNLVDGIGHENELEAWVIRHS